MSWQFTHFGTIHARTGICFATRSKDATRGSWPYYSLLGASSNKLLVCSSPKLVGEACQSSLQRLADRRVALRVASYKDSSTWPGRSREALGLRAGTQRKLLKGKGSDSPKSCFYCVCALCTVRVSLRDSCATARLCKKSTSMCTLATWQEVAVCKICYDWTGLNFHRWPGGSSLDGDSRTG